MPHPCGRISAQPGSSNPWKRQAPSRSAGGSKPHPAPHGSARSLGDAYWVEDGGKSIFRISVQAFFGRSEKNSS